jgi:uncharacterized protein DUF2865
MVHRAGSFQWPDMPEKSISPLSRWILACAALLGCATLDLSAHAQQQMNPPGPPAQAAPPVNPVCPRLEAQLATIDHGGSGDPARDEQLRRYQDAAGRQQGELDRVTSQARRMGCDSSGFFSLFNGQSAQCGPVNNQIQQMRANLDQIITSIERLRGGGFGDSERDNQRRSVLLALAQNNCGPQYAAAVRSQGNFLDNLFGNNNLGGNPSAPAGDFGPQSGTYRTVCARSCDGAYFPISFATVPARFPDDEKTCKSLCPAAEATLFAYRNPGEDISQAVSINGQPYSASPNAFRYRQEFNPTCSCKAPGQTWADALKTIDDTADAQQQGDIIVTEESAKKMSRAPTKPTPARKGTTATNTAATTPSAPDDPTAAAPSGTAPPNKPIRSVGPTFIPPR